MYLSVRYGTKLEWKVLNHHNPEWVHFFKPVRQQQTAAEQVYISTNEICNQYKNIKLKKEQSLVKFDPFTHLNHIHVYVLGSPST